MKITGTFEGLIVVKEGTGKRGPWKLYSIQVDGNKYGVGFDPVKAATGDLVEFDASTNEKGYTDADPKSFKVLGRAPAAQSQMVNSQSSGSVSGNDPRQRSIELQSSIASASRIVAAQITAGGDVPNPSAAVASIVGDFVRILHPAPKPKPKPAPEPVEDDPFDDDVF